MMEGLKVGDSTPATWADIEQFNIMEGRLWGQVQILGGQLVGWSRLFTRQVS